MDYCCVAGAAASGAGSDAGADSTTGACVTGSGCATGSCAADGGSGIACCSEDCCVDTGGSARSAINDRPFREESIANPKQVTRKIAAKIAVVFIMKTFVLAPKMDSAEAMLSVNPPPFPGCIKMIAINSTQITAWINMISPVMVGFLFYDSARIFYDGHKRIRLEACPADQSPVDVWLGHQFGDIIRLDAATVLDTHGFSGFFIVHFY